MFTSSGRAGSGRRPDRIRRRQNWLGTTVLSGAMTCAAAGDPTGYPARIAPWRACGTAATFPGENWANVWDLPGNENTSRSGARLQASRLG